MAIDRVVHLDDLVNSVPEHLVKAAENKGLSKAQRVRDYLSENPSATNMDVMEALKDFKVSSADVSQVRMRLKAYVPVKKNRVIATTSVPKTNANSNIQLSELEAGVAFVKAAGSIMRAKHLLIIIEQIKAS